MKRVDRSACIAVRGSVGLPPLASFESTSIPRGAAVAIAAPSSSPIGSEVRGVLLLLMREGSSLSVCLE